MMPTYNPKSDYMKQALNSILDQANSEMEIIVVDNCSDRVDVKSIVEEVGQNKVHYTRNHENLGHVFNWNKCIELATGKYIHIIHDDDLVNKDFYVYAERGLETYDAYACESMIINDDGKNLHLHNGETYNRLIVLDDLRYKNIIEPPSIAFRKSVFENGLRFDEQFPCMPDWKLWMDVLKNQGSIYYDSGFYNYYRVSGANGTAIVKASLINIVELERLYQYMEAIGLSLYGTPRELATQAALWELNSAFISGKDRIFFKGVKKFSKLWGVGFLKALLKQTPSLIWKRSRFTAGKWKRKLLS